jgi:hypothetical protein
MDLCKPIDSVVPINVESIVVRRIVDGISVEAAYATSLTAMDTVD